MQHRLCPACGRRANEEQSFCGKCGARLPELVGAPTFTEPQRAHSAFTDDFDEGRFPPGTVLARRYRIISLLGRGGMGEVYRANDLVLGQTIAMKFLPGAATASESALMRLRTEVRTARRVSHPNVCRVYDIGEIDGLPYLTMEYVDGEDLAALLRRIGALPHHKALHITRQLCAGLAAAHGKGVVHRDLKPANIMLDRSGQVRITDFGLAAAVEGIRDIRSGTPAYMAPEQREGIEVTHRSDIYALGVVLHELFSGRRPAADAVTHDIDPDVARVIQRCLEKDPRKRPPTALSVAAALPGGDPLRAALAAGEMPSPEMVANAGEMDGLRVSVAVACLSVILIGLVALFFLRQRLDILNQIPVESPPEVLAAKAREMLSSAGYTKRPVDTAFGWEYNTDYLRYAYGRDDTVIRRSSLRTNRPPVIYFWYRESPEHLVTGRFITRTDPPISEPEMAEVVLDSQGRLIELRVQPPARTPSGSTAPAPTWNWVFAAAGLNPDRFTAAEPILMPPNPYDTRAAWTGVWGGSSPDTVRVEAAACQSRPVFVQITGAWTREAQPALLSLGGFTLPTLLLFAIVLPAIAGLLAWRNARLGRGDRRGALRLACFALVLTLLYQLTGHHHVAAPEEAVVLFSSLRDAFFYAVIVWILYTAFEPYVRWRWPGTLISWNRLLAGRVRDPRVGADLLVGILLAVAELCLIQPFMSPYVAEIAPQLTANLGGSLSLWLRKLGTALGASLSYTFLLIALRLVVRRDWVAAPLFIALLSIVFPPEPGGGFVALAIRRALLFGLVWFSLTRFGVLTTIMLIYVHNILTAFPLTTNPLTWYAGAGIFAAATVVGLAVFALHTTLVGRNIWPKEIADV